jgi:hypothetical protein
MTVFAGLDDLPVAWMASLRFTDPKDDAFFGQLRARQPEQIALALAACQISPGPSAHH